MSEERDSLPVLVKKTDGSFNDLQIRLPTFAWAVPELARHNILKPTPSSQQVRSVPPPVACCFPQRLAGLSIPLAAQQHV
jgi:hypothetical protein